MRLYAVAIGAVLVAVLLWEVFETIILPRRVARRFRATRYFYLGTWLPFRAFARRIRSQESRENVLGVFGPASLLLLFIVWAAGLIVSYALVYWGFGADLSGKKAIAGVFWPDLYFSATTFFTLGFGDIIPRSLPARVVAAVEAGNGFGFLGLVITYLPTLYTSFSSREVNISLLDARAGSPATAGEMLRRHAHFGELRNLDTLLSDWEKWSAALMESHVSYPVLCYFRSQHQNQSWIAALTGVLDTCSLVMVGINDMPDWQARLTFAICRHALVDLVQVFHRTPQEHYTDRLPVPDWEILIEQLRREGLNVSSSPETFRRLANLRQMYEPYAIALSNLFVMPLPPWIRPQGNKDNWTSDFWASREA